MTLPDSPPPFGSRAAYDPTLLDAAAAFALGPVQETRDLGGTYNLNVQVESAAGAFVLRVHRPWVTAERLAQVQAVREGLAADFPVPEPRRTPDGAGFVSWADRLVECAPFVPHGGTADRWDRYTTAFALLGRLHAALAAAVDPVTLVPPRVSNYATPEQLAVWVGALAERVGVPARGEAPTPAQATVRAARALLEPLAAAWATTDALLPQQTIHGDYGGANLLFQGDTVVAILDFDFLGVRERAYEVAYALYWALQRLGGPAPPERLPWPRSRALLAAYNATAPQPLSAEEVAALPRLLARVPLYWVGEAGFLPDPEAALADQAAGIAFARWVLGHAPDLAALFVR